MDPRTNPYAPGAGTLPPELAGRDQLLEKAAIALDRSRNGLSARGFIIIGLRGVGKTVLLSRISQEAEARGFAVASIEAPEKRSLPSLLIPVLRSALLKLDRKAAASAIVKKTLQVLGGFIHAMKLKYEDVELSIDLGKQQGIADSGDLEHDLIELLIEVGQTVKAQKTALAIFIDEIQYIAEDQLAALIMALHKCTQLTLPILLIGAGLPQLIARVGRAKSYAERLFEYPEIGPLDKAAAESALVLPARKLKVEYQADALAEVLKQTQAYAYFIQEWGKYGWQCAESSPITREDIISATSLALNELDASFFRIRFDRLTPSEKRYLRAMAELGAGTHRSGEIAHLLQKEVHALAPVRAVLIKKGMIYSPSHGDAAFTVPLFDGYLKRAMPEFC